MADWRLNGTLVSMELGVDEGVGAGVGVGVGVGVGDIHLLNMIWMPIVSRPVLVSKGKGTCTRGKL